MMRNAHLLFVLALLGAACGGTEPVAPPEPAEAPTEAAVSDRAAKAAEIADAIAVDPSRAEAILEAHGYTTASYEALLYEVAADPELAAAYVEMRKR